MHTGPLKRGELCKEPFLIFGVKETAQSKTFRVRGGKDQQRGSNNRRRLTGLLDKFEGILGSQFGLTGAFREGRKEN